MGKNIKELLQEVDSFKDSGDLEKTASTSDSSVQEFAEFLKSGGAVEDNGNTMAAHLEDLAPTPDQQMIEKLAESVACIESFEKMAFAKLHQALINDIPRSGKTKEEIGELMEKVSMGSISNKIPQGLKKALRIFGIGTLGVALPAATGAMAYKAGRKKELTEMLSSLEAMSAGNAYGLPETQGDIYGTQGGNYAYY